MNTTHKTRLLKLAAFLSKLPRRRFDLHALRREQHKCGTVACGIGHTPEVFPRLVKEADIENESFCALALRLFGMDPDEYLSIFDHRNPLWNKNCTPKQLAEQIRWFVKGQPK